MVIKKRTFYDTQKCWCGMVLTFRQTRKFKQHLYCKLCNLEWHRNRKGRVYCHPWKINNKIWSLTGRLEREQYMASLPHPERFSESKALKKFLPPEFQVAQSASESQKPVPK